MNPAQQARQRASLILQVQAGQLSATQAAQSLGVSRKTYYQWERRALQGMVDQLTQLQGVVRLRERRQQER